MLALAMPLYWLCYHHNDQISVVIEPANFMTLIALTRQRLAGKLRKIRE
jgi:hypothetical protein